MRMRLMLLGGGNALGQAIVRLGAEEDIEFYAPRPPLGGWDAPSLTRLLDENRPDAVINLAYYYDWFQAGQVDECRFVGQEAVVEHLAILCRELDLILLQPSSYRVFDGIRTTAYTEKDETAPLDFRGRLLCRTEQLVRELNPRHILLRFGWLLDDSSKGLMGRFLHRLEQEDELLLADDRRGNPTPVEDAARVIMAVLKQLDCQAGLWGTYHYGGHEAATPMAVCQSLMAEAAAFRRPRLKGLVPIAHAKCDDATTEPQYGVLACKKIFNTFGIKPRPWRAGLSGLLHSYYRHD
ncbi:sugar nucleotide-binding protein [Azomonas macrocytogenes]|uniref:dTDP-4-dehydrorhamnose reductase n=1 Tax=Azomonas macrocytogenes TaxID=69962 RepID=A0A839T6T8_AZOMA|nr:sugar nucleotide-binding protein [Azomonas macrocytogenes]MBB3104166.1 dTDP-4-dehydrorhamnose reductase [Azomonas macrocytogenes]